MPVIDELKILVTAEVNKAIADLNKVEKSSGKASGSFKDFAKQIAGYTTGMNLAVDVTKKIATGIVNLAKESISLASAFEKSEVSWGVLMGDMTQGTAMFDELMKFAAQTPLAFESINKAATTLKGFGVSADDLIPTMRKLGDVSMGNNEALSQLALVFGQVKAQGKAMTQDLYQFVNAGIPIFQLLADTMGVSTGEVKELASQSKITFEEIEKAITKATDEGGQFYKMMDLTAETTAGKWSTAQDNFKQGLAELGETFLPLVNAALDTFNKRVAEAARLGGISKAISGGAATIEETTSAIAVLNDYITKNEKSTNGYIKEGVRLAIEEKKRLEYRLDFLKQIADQDKELADAAKKSADEEKKRQEAQAKSGSKEAIEAQKKAAEEAELAFEEWGDDVLTTWKLLDSLDKGGEIVEQIKNDTKDLGLNWSDWNIQIGDTVMSLDDIKEGFDLIYSAASDTFGAIGDLQSNQSDAYIASLEKERDQYDKNSDAYKEADTKVQAAKNAAAEKEFNAKKASAIAEAVINGAVAVAEAYPNFLLAGVIAGLTGTQVAAIGAQQYVPFASGGYVDQPTHALVGEAGGEWILNKAQMAGLAKNGIGGGGVTIVQNIGGSIWNTKQLQGMATAAVSKASRGF